MWLDYHTHSVDLNILLCAMFSARGCHHLTVAKEGGSPININFFLYYDNVIMLIQALINTLSHMAFNYCQLHEDTKHR